MPIRLDERLMAIASLVKGGRVADIGCDHGKLSYYLVSTDRAELAIATDISAPSLKKARELALLNGVEDRMQTRLGDGLSPIGTDEVDTVIIAGLGGDVISEILSSAAAEGKSFAHYILSPNTHAEKVRRQLLKDGNRIVVDRMVECGGKLYPLIMTERGAGEANELQLRFGMFFDKDEVFIKKAKSELAYLRDLLVKNPGTQSLEEKINWLEKALKIAQSRVNI